MTERYIPEPLANFLAEYEAICKKYDVMVFGKPVYIVRLTAWADPMDVLKKHIQQLKDS